MHYLFGDIKLKKIIICLFCVVIMLLFTKDNQSNRVIIPDSAIRFRIIANSNSFTDQETKIAIKTDLEPILTEIVSESNSLDETRNLINYNMNNIRTTIENHNINYNLNYGINHFPKKEYKGVTYPEGDYESLVVTLGDGLGDNWWCVLFPPLCLLEAQESEYDEYTYSFYIKDVIDKYF